nr:hypothetical protein [Tanacetum cinerariifolium]
MDFRSFMIQWVDGEFNFLLEGGLDVNQSFTKSMNNEALVINAKTIFTVHPSDVVKNIVDSYNISADEGELSSIGPDAPTYLEEGKRSMASGKRKVGVGSHGEGPHRKILIKVVSFPFFFCAEFSSVKELKDATDCHWVIAHVTPPSWKHYLRGISIE